MATLTRILAISAALLFQAVAPPSLGSTAAQVGAAANDAPMTFRYVSNGGNCNGCEWVAAEGVITQDTPADFRRFMANRAYKLDIVLSSSGGNLIAGMELGREIRKRGLFTSVGRSIPFRLPGLPEKEFYRVEDGLCASACALAFLGGVERRGGPVGFHQASLALPPGETERLLVPLGGGLSAGQLLAGVMVAYTMEMGVDPRVISLAMATPPTDLYVLTPADAKRLRVVTTRQEDPTWRLAVVRDGLVLVGEGEHIGREPFTASLSCFPNRPGALRAIVSFRVNPAAWGTSDPARDMERMLPNLDTGGVAGVTRLPYRFERGEISAAAMIEAPGQQAIRTTGLRLYWGGAHAWAGLVPPLLLRGRDVSDAIPLLLRNCPR